MPPSEEESLWLVGKSGSVSSFQSTVGGQITRPITHTRGTLYTEEMTSNTSKESIGEIPTTSTITNVNSSALSSGDHEIGPDSIDSTADIDLMSHFHEDAIKQV